MENNKILQHIYSQDFNGILAKMNLKTTLKNNSVVASAPEISPSVECNGRLKFC